MGIKTLTHPLKAVLLDWAGTTVDYGSLAPTEVFIEIFRRCGIAITVAEAREPMGRAKHEHIAAIAGMKRVAALWNERYGHDPTRPDIEAMYRDFLPLQKETLANMGSEVLPGIPQAIAELRAMGLRVGSSTGYTRELMSVVAPIAARDGYAPDVIICSDDVPAGRPAPWMNFLAAQHLGVYPMSAIVVVDDTAVGIEAGLNSGAFTVGITQTGNALGLAESDVARLPADELQSRLAIIESQFVSLGAHLTIPSVANLPNILKQFTAD